MTDGPDPMPVFVLKAKDNLAPIAVDAYIGALRAMGRYHQAGEAQSALDEINGWRARNPAACKWPDHEHIPAGLPGSGSEEIA